jgi:hypothetical protein
MSVARCGLHPTIPVQSAPAVEAPTVTAVRARRPTTDPSEASRMPQLTTGRTADGITTGRTAGDGSSARPPGKRLRRLLLR